MANTIDVKVPDIGDYKDVPIIEVLVKPGEVVKADQSLVTLESDKATMDVPAPGAGTVREIVAKVGDKVAMGSLILRLEPAAGAGAAPAAPAPPAPAAVPAPPAAPAAAPPAPAAGPAPADFSGVLAGPAVRRLARELDLDLTHLRGTGEKGRITREDVKAALAGGVSGGAAAGAALPEIPAVDFSRFGPVETRPLSRIKRISGPRLHASWLNVPHVTHSDEADVTDLDAFRKRLDDEAKVDKKAPYRVSLLPLLMKASVSALKAFPTFNASLTPAKDALVFKQVPGTSASPSTRPRAWSSRWCATSTARASSSSRGSSALCPPRRAKASFRRPKWRARVSPSPRSAASAARRSRRSSMRRKSPSSASCAPRWRRCGTARRSLRA